MIPNRMSFYFAGEHLTWLRYLSLATFRKLNPYWEIDLWTSPFSSEATWPTGESQDFEYEHHGKNYWNDVESLGVQVRQWEMPDFLRGANPVHLSDFCRWQVLEQYGGWYADTDILWIRPMMAAGLVDVPVDAAMVTQRDHVPIGFMGGRPGAGIYGTFGERAAALYDPNRYQSAGCEVILAVAGVTPARLPMVKLSPLVIRGWIDRKFEPLSINYLPPGTVYPFGWSEVNKIFTETHDVWAGAIGIHWFGGSRPAQRFSQRVNAGNYQGYKSTFCHFAQRVLDV
jgi:hypothetical protein